MRSSPVPWSRPYPTGSLVYAQPVAGEDLQVGDVAAFWRDEDVIIHRVDSIDIAGEEFVAKGDANDDVDLRPVLFRDVLGRVVFSVPGVGYFLMALGSVTGKLLLGWVVLMAPPCASSARFSATLPTVKHPRKDDFFSRC